MLGLVIFHLYSYHTLSENLTVEKTPGRAREKGGGGEVEVPADRQVHVWAGPTEKADGQPEQGIKFRYKIDFLLKNI